MDRDGMRRTVVRYGILFLISVVLVAGFWFHAEFYQIGFVPLLVLGGLATFLVLLTLRALGSGVLWRARPRGALPFPRDAGERVLAGTQTLAILPATADVPPAGTATRAVAAPTQQALVTIRIRDVRRRLAGDVRAEEAALAGFDDLEEFRTTWSRGRRWDPHEVVTLVEFRKEARS